jgi:hypothetical protein
LGVKKLKLIGISVRNDRAHGFGLVAKGVGEGGACSSMPTFAADVSSFTVATGLGAVVAGIVVVTDAGVCGAAVGANA